MRICLIGPLHVSFNPRLLREAETLTDAGHEVRVVCKQSDPALRLLDERVMKGRRWKLDAVNHCRNGSLNREWLTASLQSRVLEKVFRFGLRMDHVAARAYVRGYAQLQRIAERQEADWFIAHTLPGLPIAAAAARRWKAKLGFDCEDLLAEAGADLSNLADRIERGYLSKCNYVSVPSEAIGSRLVEQHKIPTPIVLYNVFAKSMAEGMGKPFERLVTPTLRFHWFSQTIGEGRGLEEAIEALSLVDAQVELHLRGRISDGYKETLRSICRAQGDKLDLVFHPVIEPDSVIRSLGQFDIGLALERPTNGNASRTVSNKIGSYLLGGLAIVATDTPGQREIMEQIPAAGFVYTAGQPHEFAHKLAPWIKDRNALHVAQRAAWDGARARFCWEIEKRKFLEIFEAAPTQQPPLN